VTENSSEPNSKFSSLSTANEPHAELVSVVIPAYNAESTIEHTVASVTAQTYRKLEVIVVDDGSLDRTAALVAKLAERDSRIRLLRKANAGLAAARNTGIENARGDFIAPVDADDLWHPTKIEKQLAVMHRGGRSIGVVYCWSRAIGSAGQIYFDHPAFDFRGDVFAPLIFWNFIQSGSLLFRRTLAMEFGGYDVALATRGAAMCEDLKFNLDLAERCDFDLVPEFLTGYTLRPGSLSTNTAAMLRSRSIVVGEARIKHPELPPRLFRWASAINARECSRVYLQEGRFPAALTLLLNAALKDPLGALSPDVGRILVGGVLTRLGLRERFGALLARWQDPYAAANSVRKRTYLEADPRRFTGRPATRWGSQRVHDVSGFRTARLEPLTLIAGDRHA
jgi:glycosyltransferase involved in cell wall biosynthesis